MAENRRAADDATALMREAEAWRKTLAGDPDATAPVLVAWTAWRWAAAARRLIEAGEQRQQTIVVVTLLAHARILLDLLDAGRVDTAAALHARATHGAERLTAQSLGDDTAFIRWRSHGQDTTASRRWLTALRRRLSV